MEIMQNILNFKFVNNIYKNRIILDYICVFIIKMKRDNDKMLNQIIENYKSNINENYKLIKNKIKELDELIKRPYQKDIYKDAINLKNKIYDDLLEPDIIMINSNPLKNDSNNIYSLNNQYYILDKLKKDINEHIRLKSYVLNNENLSKALNEKGEILIIQSDNFTDNGEIVCETKNGESKLLTMNNLINILENKKINYKVIILCFPNSCKIKKYFNNFPYVISFEYFNNLNLKENILKELNKASIEFIIDFIKNITNEKLNNEIKKIFDLSKNRFLDNIKSFNNEINYNDSIILSNNENIALKIEYLKEIEDKHLFLYNPLLKFNNITIKENENIPEYSSKIYKIIQKIEKNNKIIYYCDESTKNKYLKTCFEVMKFYHRHKTYNELFCIDIERGDKALLQSIIRKMNEFRKIDSKEKENEENIQLKNCFILIYNCYRLDLLDVDLFSLLNNNSSYIIIYDNENYKYYKKNAKISEILNTDEIEINEPISNISPNEYLNNKEIMPNIESKEIGEYKIIQKIGSNGFSSTFAVIKKDGIDKKLYMLYTLEKDNYESENDDSNNIIKFINGINILEELNAGTNCKYIPILYANNKYEYEGNNKNYIDIENQKKENLNKIRPYYVTDYFSRGNLFYYLKQFGVLRANNKIQEKHIKLLFKKIISCIQFCHNKNIYLLDIKPSNFVFDKEFNPIFIDYSLSMKLKNSSDIIVGARGAREYMFPEIYKSGFKGEKADIFSLGALLFNLVTGINGFISSNIDDQFYKFIVSYDIESYWNSLKKYIDFDLSQEFKDLYIKMISYDPSERPSLTQILESKWMEEINKLVKEDLGKVEKELENILNDLYNSVLKEGDEELAKTSKLEMEYLTK